MFPFKRAQVLLSRGRSLPIEQFQDAGDVAVYEMVRHAGLILTLNQAAAAGFDDARVPAARADAYARTLLVRHDDWIALHDARATARIAI
jgi:hypothetical protein